MNKKYAAFYSWIRIMVLIPLMLCNMPICNAQFTYGTTGLMHAPTAEMQKDKTFMFGGGYLDVHPMSQYWSANKEYKPFTFNYYVNITLFPWLEVAYECTLVKGLHNSSYWPQSTWGRFVNQDRAFHARLRIWKEGWWQVWTPQIVVGLNDPASHSYNGGGNIDLGGGNEHNHNYKTRYYLAATKYFDFKGLGGLGTHISYVLGRAMLSEHYKRPAAGVNFKFDLLPEDNFAVKALNGLNLMAEYDARTINIGAHYQLWKDHINLIAELNDGKYFSGGIYFKIHLK